MKLLFIYLLIFLLTACENNDFIIERNFITVHVQGEVTQELTITLPIDSKINELLNHIEITSKANKKIFDSEIILHHNDTIIVPANDTILVSINFSDFSQLVNLPKIGKVIASRIIAFRQIHGLFNSLEEIMLVKGIKEKTFSTIEDLICL
ncbi:MAG: ComEA family DNA-binding protein [Erysipelotrichaceae bacterium]